MLEINILRKIDYVNDLAKDKEGSSELISTFNEKDRLFTLETFFNVMSLGREAIDNNPKLLTFWQSGPKFLKSRELVKFILTKVEIYPEKINYGLGDEIFWLISVYYREVTAENNNNNSPEDNELLEFINSLFKNS